MKPRLEKMIKIIRESDNIVFFGGAGVSTASSIPDFRGEKGIYNYSPEDIITNSFFEEHPDKFFEFYFENMVFENAMPNQTHKFLAALEKTGKLKAVITQNIDGLHQKAGSKNVIELHGSVQENTCMSCHKEYSLKDVIKKGGVPKCDCGGIIKPNVVLYEEPLDSKNMMNAIKYIERADTLIVAGTSLVVYPAASFINYFKGKNKIVINLGETSANSTADVSINGKVEDYLNMNVFNRYVK